MMITEMSTNFIKYFQDDNISWVDEKTSHKRVCSACVR